METKKFTQYGKFSILVLLPMILLFAAWWIKYTYSEHQAMMFPLYISFFLLVLLLLLYKLTIIIDEKKVSFKMGIGLIGRTFLISDIKSCKPVTNYFLSGFGIRLIRNGWLYNVSGFKAIELSFHNRNSIVRIGTDRPEEICAIIRELSGNISVEKEEANPYPAKSLTPRLIIISTIIVLFIGFIISVKQDRKVVIDNSSIKIKGVYGVTIPIADINQVDTIPFLPQIQMKTNGYADGSTLVGYFRMADETKAKLFVRIRHSPYIRIISKHQIPVYLNFDEKQKTVDLYKKLTDVFKK